VRVGEGVAGGCELVEEAAGDCDVNAAKLGREWLHLHSLPRRARGRRHHIRGARVGTRQFFRKNQSWRTRHWRPNVANLGHDGAQGRRFDRQERRRDLLRLALRRVEEPRQHVGPILGSDDLRELDDAREVEPAVSERLDDLRVPLDELRRGLPVEGRSLRKTELAMEKIEERGVPDRRPHLPAVEVREGNEKHPERVVLATEKVGEAGGLFTGSWHARMVARISEASWNARIRILARDPEHPSRTLHATPRSPRRCRGGVESALPERLSARHRPCSRNRSSSRLGRDIRLVTIGESRCHCRQRGRPGHLQADLAGTPPSRGAASAAAPVVARTTPPEQRRLAGPRRPLPIIRRQGPPRPRPTNPSGPPWLSSRIGPLAHRRAGLHP
jgi:hypothetical protein